MDRRETISGFTKDFACIHWGKELVPHPWDYYETELWYYEGIGWYTITINPNKIYNGL